MQWLTCFEEMQDEVDLESQERPISVLLLTTKWQFDTYGLSTVNKSLVNNLRVVDQEGKKIKITCAVVEEEKNITDYDKKDAAQYKVELRGAKQPRGAKKKAAIEWLDQNIATYYPDLLREDSYDFVIGHVPYLTNGPLNIKDLYQDTERKPKVILMIHELPKTTDGGIDEDVDWLYDADFVFSIGKSVESEIASFLTSRASEQHPIHKCYVPGFPLEFFNVRPASVDGNKIQGNQNVTIMTGEQKDLETGGIDFSLAVTSTTAASKQILDSDGVETNLFLLTENKEDTEKWHKEFKEIVKAEKEEYRTSYFHLDSPNTLEKWKVHLIKSNLMILPLKSCSPVFDSKALSAIAAGVPVLISNHSGVASLLAACLDEYNIQESNQDSGTETWTKAITHKLLNPADAQQAANRLREQLLLDTSIAQTHLDFVRTVVGTLSVDIKIEVISDSVVSQQHIDLATRFGVDLGNLSAPVETKKYILAFIHKLLLQRDKLDRRQLKDYLQSDIAKLWQEVLSVLEKFGRKLLGVKNGSLIFTLFCPTISSAQELIDDSWLRNLMAKTEKLVTYIGLDPQLRIHSLEAASLFPETELLPRLRKKKSRHTGQSEGYETISQHSSEIVCEIFHDRRRVMDWLDQQPDVIIQPEAAAGTSAMALLETMKANLTALESAGDGSFTKLTVSKLSGSVGIVSTEGKPSLSVTYPGTDKPTLILSKDNRYRSALFVTISGEEYLIAASKDCIHLWNLAENTPKAAYMLNEENDWHLSAIDDRTVACVPEHSDDCQKIYILNTDTEEFTLSGTIPIQAYQMITDLCHAKRRDGTSCLLLCMPWENSVKSMEMCGWEVKWQTCKQQMGETFLPWSICTDESTAFLINVFEYKLHVLSVEDGSALMATSLYPFGIDLPGCVCLHGEHLFVGHMNKKGDRYCVSKFTRPVSF